MNTYLNNNKKSSPGKNQRTKLIWKTVLIMTVMFLSIWSALPLDEKLNLGLDLKGGTYLVLDVQVEDSLKKHADRASADKDTTLSPEELNEMKRDIMRQSVETIRERVDRFGVSGAGVQEMGGSGDFKIMVSLPGVDDPERVKDIVESTAMLEFRHVAAGPFKTEKDALATFNGTLPKDLSIVPTNPNQLEPGFFILKQTPVITGDHLQKVTPGRNEFGNPEIHFSLNDAGTKNIRDYSAANVGQSMAIVFDDQIESVAGISSVLGRHSRLTGNYSIQEVNDMVLKLRSGALPASMVTVEERVVGPSLGADSIRQGITSVVTGLLLVIFFMIAYYKGAGINSVIALLFNLVILVGVMASMGFTLTLPGIAGIILTIGMAVDANVLIFERIKEEQRQGKSIKASIKAGFQKALVTITDANITTVIAAFFLMQMGSGAVKGFAVTLIIGICASLFTALFVSRVIFQWMYTNKQDTKAPRKTKPTPAPASSFHGKMAAWNWMKRPWLALALSGVILIVGLAAYFTNGINTGIDFSGGTIMEIELDTPTNEQVIRDRLADAGLAQTKIQRVGTSPGQRFFIRTQPQSNQLNPANTDKHDKTAETIKNALTPLGNVNVLRSDTVGPQVGDTFRKNSILSVAWALLGMFIYIGFRFRWRYSLAAVITLAHDTLICLTVIILFGVEVSLPVIAALLSIIGYSLNDTIVIFDRVRDNSKKSKLNTPKKGENLKTIINQSISQTLSRTLVTSGTTLLSVLAMLFLGGPVLFPFALTLLVGIVVGTYSSIFQSCAWLTVGKMR